MALIEFQTYVHQGTIAVPKEYADRITGQVRVLILVQEDREDIDMIEYLMEHPYQASDSTLLTRDELYERP